MTMITRCSMLRYLMTLRQDRQLQHPPSDLEGKTLQRLLLVYRVGRCEGFR
jgi:hypothetical protein